MHYEIHLEFKCLKFSVQCAISCAPHTHLVSHQTEAGKNGLGMRQVCLGVGQEWFGNGLHGSKAGMASEL